MADVRDLIPRAERTHEAGATGFWYATVTKPVPVTEQQPLWVIIPDIDVRHKWGPCKWSPQSTQVPINVAESGEPVHTINVMVRVLPALKDSALVAFDNRGIPWVIAYGS